MGVSLPIQRYDNGPYSIDGINWTAPNKKPITATLAAIAKICARGFPAYSTSDIVAMTMPLMITMWIPPAKIAMPRPKPDKAAKNRPRETEF